MGPSQDQSSTHEGHLHVYGAPNTLTDPWIRAKDFPPETMAAVGIELLAADALLSRLVTMYPSKMLAAHRSAVASLTAATDASTLAALRRAKATKTADLMESLLKPS